MSVPHCRRCWPAWALASAAWFAYLEREGYRNRCHRTLSRELRALLGRRGCWLFAALGLILSLYLLHLKETPPCPDVMKSRRAPR